MGDPISGLLGLGAGLVGSLFGHKGGGQQPMPNPPPPPPRMNPTGSANTNKQAQNPSFLAASAPPAPAANQGGKSLLGQ